MSLYSLAIFYDRQVSSFSLLRIQRFFVGDFSFFSRLYFMTFLLELMIAGNEVSMLNHKKYKLAPSLLVSLCLEA